MIVALDLETTGTDYNNDEIIEISMIKFDENTFEILEEYTSFVNPGIHIPEIISNITNIFDEDVNNAPCIKDILFDIEEFIGDSPVLGHNIKFDINFLISKGLNIDESIILLDTMFLSNFLVLDITSLNLEALCNYFNIKIKNFHRSYNDIFATYKLFRVLISEFNKLSIYKKQVLYYVFSKTDDKSVIFFIDYLGLNKFKDIKKEDILEILLKNIKGYKYKLNNTVTEDINIDFSEDIFKEFINFEVRENQLKVSSYIKDSLLNNLKIVIEAPTGVGKTFAYLVPSILYSIKTGKKVVISTNTKALQDQIINKDLEFLKDNLFYDFSYCKLKGKSNYLGISPFLEEIFSDLKLDLNEVSFLSKISMFIFTTNTGELDELNFYGEEFKFLNVINADKFYILKDSNKYRKYEYIYKARQASQKSNIVIVNHSILLQDFYGDNAILGKVDKLVIDEAHNLEDTVTEAIKYGINYIDIEEKFSNIGKIIKKFNFIFEEYDIYKSKILLDLSYIFDTLNSYFLSKNFGDTTKDILIGYDYYLDNQNIFDKVVNIKLMLIDFINILKSSDDNCYKNLLDYISSLEKDIEILKVILNKELLKDNINIISITKSKGIIVYNTLLSPGIFLKEKLWDKISSIILISATIRTGDSFNYIKNILSIGENFKFYVLDTDFNYRKQVLLFIPTDLGSIKNSSSIIFNFLKKLFLTIKGRSLVLFTSLLNIKEAFLFMNLDLKNNNINLYAQGINGGKHKLLELFKNNSDNSILFGTDTFWEGIDISGNKLEYLIIYKLPFPVPDDPIFKARSKIFDNSFLEYAIPKTILKLRQGFGRLIRTKKDKGIVIFLDDRIYKKTWGLEFFKAFPEGINIKKGSSDNFLEIIKNIKRKK